MIEVVFTIGSYRGDCSLDSWTSAVAAHVVYKHIRRRKIERRIFGRLDADLLLDAARPRERVGSLVRNMLATRAHSPRRGRRRQGLGVRAARRVRLRPPRDRADHRREHGGRADAAHSRPARGPRAHRGRPGARQPARVVEARDERAALRPSRQRGLAHRFGPGSRLRIRTSAPRAIAAIARAIVVAPEATAAPHELRRIRGRRGRAPHGVRRLSAGGTRAPSPSPPRCPDPVAQIVAHPVGGASSVVVSGAQGPLDDGRLLAPGSRVVTPANGRAMLSFSTGSSVLLREGTD